MKQTTITAAFFAVIGTAAMAQQMPVSALEFLDVDDDAQVSQEEFTEQMDKFFAPMDANGSGQLEYGEVESFISREIFDATDANGNGRISSSEYKTQILKDFEASDVDADGVLD